MTITYKIASEADLEALAHLRIEVFYEWPYLYEGSLEYERNYLRTYSECKFSRIFLAIDGEKVVGASSCIPLEFETEEVIKPLVEAGLKKEEVMYFGESVLKKGYRGQGIGVKFFELREAYAKELRMKTCVFCGVVRPDYHSFRPSDYIPLNEFWKKRGYQILPNVLASFQWKDLGEKVETVKQLQFWSKTN